MSMPVVNFGLVTVSTGYSSGATSIVLQTGDGSKLPGDFPFPLTWWDATNYAHPADDPNVEIVYCTARSTDTLTVSRAEEGTSASNKNTAASTYRMSLSFTKAMYDALQRPKSFVQGLQLQTHRDSDLAPYQVELVDVDSIIMDDGTELRNDNDEWSGKVADITVSGAGGLDTGTEDVQIYEIYAIAKEDGTRNLILHLSKVWAIDTNNISILDEDASQGIRSAVDNSTVKVAQGFKLSNSGVCPYIEAKLIKVGAPTGKIWFTIETDSAGKPSGTPVATSQAYDVSRLATTSSRVRIPMKSSNVLSANPTQYHLVAQGAWTVSATNYVAWRMDGSAGTYTPGSKALFDSDTSTWTTDTDDDMMFAVAIEKNVSLVTMPSGYTKKCFLGWVSNNSSSDFTPFIQTGRTMRFVNINTDDNRIWGTNGSAELIDLLGFIPPLPLCRTYMALSGTGTAGALVAIGDLRATDISSAGTSVGAQVVMSTSITSTMPSSFSDIIVQHNGIMAQGTGGAYLWIVGYDF